MMAACFIPLILGVLTIASALPAITLQDLEVADDTMSIGTYIREVRAATPEDWHKSYESEGDGEIGYSRKKSGGGKKGYQHFDSYHKKAGDHYEFEKQDAYGLEKKEQDGAYSNRDEQKAVYRRRPDDVEEIEGTKKNRKEKRPLDDFPEIEHEELKEGAPDGNGGVEAHGHDPNDYILPEKYTYGSGEEYNF